MQSVDLRFSLEITPEDIIKDLTEGIDFNLATGAFLFISPDIDAETICKHFNDLIPFAGCTANSTFCTGFTSLTTKHKINTSQTAQMIFLFEEARCASGLLDAFPKSTKSLFCFTTSERHTRNAVNSIRMIGGVASTGTAGFAPAVWANHVFSYDGAVAITPPSASYTVQVSHGWAVINQGQMIITRAEDTKLYELDGQNAFEAYLALVHDTRIFTLFPLHSSQKNKFVSILNINEEGRYLELTQPLNVGDQVQLSTSSRADILASTNLLASTTFSNNTNDSPEFIFCISCSSREWLLSEDPAAEFKNIQPFYSSKKVSVIYLDGEFAPSENGSTHLNNSIVMTTIFEKDSDRLPDF